MPCLGMEKRHDRKSTDGITHQKTSRRACGSKKGIIGVRKAGSSKKCLKMGAADVGARRRVKLIK